MGPRHKRRENYTACLEGFGMLVPSGVAELVRLGIERPGEGLLHRRTCHLDNVPLNLPLVNLDDVTQVLLRRSHIAQGPAL
jgi:hypothetical protein